MPASRKTQAIPRKIRAALPVLGLLFLASIPVLAQEKSAEVVPVALVVIDGNNSARVTGALEVAQGRAVIVSSGSISAGEKTAEVTLPRRGLLRVCASTTVKLAADASIPASEAAGLMLALDRGALEMSLATTRNADVVMTPDFRILVAGPGAAEVKVRLGEHGDTCVENSGANAPYVLVSSVFEGGAFRVQPGQRVMFQHGSLREVVDNEKESCGCPPVAGKNRNEFPLAQSAGLEPMPGVTPPINPMETGPLVYNSPAVETKPAAEPQAEPQKKAEPPALRKGFFSGLGRFFRKLFGAE